jgi:hypothetical protein
MRKLFIEPHLSNKDKSQPSFIKSQHMRCYLQILEFRIRNKDSEFLLSLVIPVLLI